MSKSHTAFLFSPMHISMGNVDPFCDVSEQGYLYRPTEHCSLTPIPNLDMLIVFWSVSRFDICVEPRWDSLRFEQLKNTSSIADSAHLWSKRLVVLRSCICVVILKCLLLSILCRTTEKFPHLCLHCF